MCYFMKIINVFVGQETFCNVTWATLPQQLKMEINAARDLFLHKIVFQPQNHSIVIVCNILFNKISSHISFKK